MERKKLLPGRYNLDEFKLFIETPAAKAGMSEADYVRQRLGMPPKIVKRGAPVIHGRFKDWRIKHPNHKSQSAETETQKQDC